MKNLIAFGFCLLSFKEVIAQQNDFLGTQASRISIRKNFETETEDDDKAANLSFTSPKDASNHFLINGGIGYTYSNTDQHRQLSYSGFGVYNRNNQIDKEQKNYKFGGNFNYTKRLSVNFRYMSQNTAEYLHDYIDTSHSLLFTSYWMPWWKQRNKLKFGGYNGGHLIGYFFNIKPGLEYQQKFALKESANKGYDLRGYLGGSINLMMRKPFYDNDTLGNHVLQSRSAWTKGIELIVSYDARESISKSLGNQESFSHYFKTEIQIYPFNNTDVSFGVSYNEGFNPIDGLKAQNFWLFSLKLKKDAS